MTPEDYDFWLLDLDGTLVDTEWSYTRSVFDRAGDRLGRHFSDSEAEILWHGLGGPRNDYLRELGFDPIRFWDAFHSVEDPEARAEATYLYDDASFVKDLDVPVGIVTHSQPFLADPVLENLGISDWFETIVSCSEELGWKPDPAPVELAMDRLGVDPERQRGVLAGDAASDVGAARNAGLDGIRVDRHKPNRQGKHIRAAYRITSFDELWARSSSD